MATCTSRRWRPSTRSIPGSPPADTASSTTTTSPTAARPSTTTARGTGSPRGSAGSTHRASSGRRAARAERRARLPGEPEASGTHADADHHPGPAPGKHASDRLVEQARRGIVEVEAQAIAEPEADLRPAVEGPRPLLDLVVHRGVDQELLLAALFDDPQSRSLEERDVLALGLPAEVPLAIDQ